MAKIIDTVETMYKNGECHSIFLNFRAAINTQRQIAKVRSIVINTDYRFSTLQLKYAIKCESPIL